MSTVSSIIRCARCTNAVARCFAVSKRCSRRGTAALGSRRVRRATGSRSLDRAGERAAPGWGTSPTLLPAQAWQPSPILYPRWVNMMSVAQMTALALASSPTRPGRPFFPDFPGHFRGVSDGFLAAPESHTIPRPRAAICLMNKKGTGGAEGCHFAEQG